MQEQGTNGEKTYLRLRLEDLKKDVDNLYQNLLDIKVCIGQLSVIDWEKFDERLRRVETCIEGLNVKSGIWGLIGGILATIGTLLVYFLAKK